MVKNMIVGDRVDYIEANIKSRIQNAGMNISMRLLDVKKKDDMLEYYYEYNVDYKDAGHIMIKGAIIGKNEPEEIFANWEKNKKVSAEQMQKLVNMINYVGSAHGTLVARVLNFRPPMIPPKLSVKVVEAKPKSEKSKK
jgi:hypothetical protein